MDHDDAPTPQPGALYDAHAVGAMIGISSGTLREHVRKGATWVPQPMARVGGAWVWRGEDIDLERVKSDRPQIGRPKGAKDLTPRKRSTMPAPVDPVLVEAAPTAEPSPVAEDAADTSPAVTEAVPDAEDDGWWAAAAGQPTA